MATTVDSLTKSVLKTVAQTDTLPTHAVELAKLPRTHNGLGIFSFSRSASLAFVLPLIRSIQYATTGLHLRH
eukprot:7731189-Ditylum_brightwellii.AAC.1